MKLWRDEFSIEAGHERYVARRQFGKFLVLTSFGMFAGNLWILLKSYLRKDEVFPRTLIARTDDVPKGGVKLFNYPSEADPCLLFHTHADLFVAYSQKCTHLSCAVIPAEDGRRIECPCHHGFFSIEDGRVLQGPPPRPLPRIVLDRVGNELWAVSVDLGSDANVSLPTKS
ncbi:MAG: Rieske (2Fe-2S) protein [Vicinamibacteria bacterium]